MKEDRHESAGCQSGKSLDRIPVASSRFYAQTLLDERVGQLGATRAIGVPKVDLTAPELQPIGLIDPRVD